MPLLWSHAEFLKLLVARENGGRPIEMLVDVERRYAGATPPAAARSRWRTEAPLLLLAALRELLIEDREPFSLRFGIDGWKEPRDRDATLGPFGLWSVALTADDVGGHASVEFTRRYGERWEGKDHTVALARTPVTHALRRAR